MIGEATHQGFCHALAQALQDEFPGGWESLVVFVPTTRVAARLRARLSHHHTGILPTILTLKGTPELAETLNLTPPPAADELALRLEILHALRTPPSGGDDLFSAADNAYGDMFAADEIPSGDRLWKRVENLYAALNRLALYGIGVEHVRATVPQGMTAVWERQAATLLHVAAHLEGWLKRRGEVWPGAAERHILTAAAQVLGDENGPWRPVVAGVLDGPPAAAQVLHAAARRGRVYLPQLGAATQAMAENLMQAFPATQLAVAAPAQKELAVTATDWDEAWVAALALRRAYAAGQGRVAAVSPSQVQLQRVQGILAGWGLPVTLGGQVTLAETPLGRHMLARPHWGTGTRKLSVWRKRTEEYGFAEHADWPEILLALHRLEGLEGWLDEADWSQLLRKVLGGVAARTQPPATGISLLGPLDARLMDFDTVVAVGCAEGTWPSPQADVWLTEAHLRALGLPDAAHRMQRMGTELESVLAAAPYVLATRPHTVEGRESVPSRFLEGHVFMPESGLTAAATHLRTTQPLAAVAEGCGVFVPTGPLWPRRWSASFIEALLACPYRAQAERILNLKPLDPLLPEADPRTGGLFAHRWLERAGRAHPQPQHEETDALTASLQQLAEAELEPEAPVTQAIWRAKAAKLAPALAARWQASGRTVAAVENKLTRTVGAVTVAATLDRVETTAAGGTVIIDYKTGTPPAWSKVAAGVKPQLALEAWLAGAGVTGLEYWQLRGYGSKPLVVTRAGEGENQPLEPLLEHVQAGVENLVATFTEGAAFPALPDQSGGGLLATGACASCPLGGVCRRKAALSSPSKRESKA